MCKYFFENGDFSSLCVIYAYYVAESLILGVKSLREINFHVVEFPRHEMKFLVAMFDLCSR